MSNLKTFDNLYANLARSAYENSPYNFRDFLKKAKDYTAIDYSTEYKTDSTKISGGQNLPNNGIVYVHKDKSVNIVKEYMSAGDYMEYEKGLFKDDLMGFQSYILTDTPTLNSETKNAYLAVKGSDQLGLTSVNDWIGNNLPFTLDDVYTIQGRLAHQALTVKLSELREKSPQAKMNVTGHSLGSIAAVQGVANLSMEELNQIGEVVVFHGPDTLNSLKKMGITDEKISILNEKITYYVNPFDIVSMLNRENNEQLGKVKTIIPMNFQTTFGVPSSHDFGELQIQSTGSILVASEDFHPEFLRAGKKVSDLVSKYRDKIKNKGLGLSIFEEIFKWIKNNTINVHSLTGNTEKLLIDEFNVEYEKIVEETRKETLKWALENIPKMKARLQSVSGAEEILLRSQILMSVAQVTRIESEDKTEKVKKIIKSYKDNVSQVVSETRHQGYGLTTYLSSYEVNQILSTFQQSTFWDDSVESKSIKTLDDYRTKLFNYSEKLFQVVNQLEAVDKSQGEIFN